MATKYQRLLNQVVKKESKKRQVDITQMREILAHLSDMAFENPIKLITVLFENGQRRDHDARMLASKKRKAKKLGRKK